MMKKAAGRQSRWTVPLSKTTVLSATVPSNILPTSREQKSNYCCNKIKDTIVSGI